jgi:hypothetical protein
MTSLLDINYEEISCDRNINDANWSNGLQNFRFSVSNSGDSSWLPALSYFVLEYSFGSKNGATDNYTATEALKQSQKITLANDWVSSMYTAASFRIAGVDVNNINNSLPQVSALKNRMKLKASQIDLLSGDLTSWEPDFSRRLSKHCIDGVYHRDGLIDCSPYLSNASGPYNVLNTIGVLSCSGSSLAKTFLGASGVYSYVGSGMQAQGNPPAGANPWTWAFANNDGTGDVIFNGGAALVIKSIKYKFPATSATGDSKDIIDGTLIQVGNRLKLDAPGGRAQAAAWEQFTSSDFVVTQKNVVGDAIELILTIDSSNFTNGSLTVLYTANSANVFTLTSVVSNSQYSQPGPRSNYTHNMTIWQPPLSIFEEVSPYFCGDLQITLTPNSNWRTSAIESAFGLYSQDPVHGTDYVFGIKSLKFYVARNRITESLPQKITLTMKDFIVSNKQMTGSNCSLDFTVPPSTTSLVVFIQDSSAGTLTKLPFSRFKSRQDSKGGDMTNFNKYGPWIRTFDERLLSAMTTMCGITKPMTTIQTTTSPGPLNNTMLQKYLMTQNFGNTYDTESYFDWLTNGPYYYFNYERDSENLGTYLNVKLSYHGDPPTQGTPAPGLDLATTINVFVVAIYDRDIALSYSEYGSIIAVQTSMQ